jgi:hypothetical protein
MIDPGLRQDAERLRVGVIWAVGLGCVAVTALLVVIAWWFVVPPPASAYPPGQPSPLEHRLFDRATGASEVRAAGEARLERYEWVDRRAGVVRIPIGRAIDAVVADPSLIGAGSRALFGKAGR